MRSVRAGALATLVPGNTFPFASLVDVATARTAARSRRYRVLPPIPGILHPILAFRSSLGKTGAGDPLAHPRVTIMGTGECVIDPDGRAALMARFSARHPKSALYADFADFSFWRVAMEQRIERRIRTRRTTSKRPLSPHRSTARKPWSRPNRKRLPR